MVYFDPMNYESAIFAGIGRTVFPSEEEEKQIMKRKINIPNIMSDSVLFIKLKLRKKNFIKNNNEQRTITKLNFVVWENLVK